MLRTIVRLVVLLGFFTTPALAQPALQQSRIVWPEKMGLPDGATAPRLLSPILLNWDNLDVLLPGLVDGSPAECEMMIGSDGKVWDARPLKTMKSDSATTVFLRYVEGEQYLPARRNGRPVAVRVIQRIVWPQMIPMGEPAGVSYNGPVRVETLLEPPVAHPIATLDMQHPDDAYRTGLAHLEKKEFDAAISDFTLALAHAPDNPQYLADRGEAYVRRDRAGDWNKALADFQRVIAFDPNNPGGYRVRAEAYLLHKQPRDALADADTAIFLAPQIPELYGQREDIDRALGDLAQANQDEKAALLLNPEFAIARISAGNARHVEDDSFIAPNAPARVDPLWEAPRISSSLMDKWNLSGRVTLMVNVAWNGKPRTIRIKQGSGYAVLDAAAMLSAGNWGYLPATQNGRAQPDEWTQVNVEYPSLSGAPPAQLPAWPAALPAGAAPPKRIPDSAGSMASPYPSAAMALKQEGETELDVLIGADGAVQDIKMRRSSGYGLLDAAAMHLAESRRYQPAQQNGVPLAARAGLRMDWKMPMGTVAGIPERQAVVEISDIAE